MHNTTPLLAALSPTDRPAAEAILHALDTRAGIHDIAVLAQMSSARLAVLLVEHFGDNPYTLADDQERARLAEAIVTAARAVTAGLASNQSPPLIQGSLMSSDGDPAHIAGAMAWPEPVALAVLYRPLGEPIPLHPAPIDGSGRFTFSLVHGHPGGPQVVNLGIEIQSRGERIGGMGPLFRVVLPCTVTVTVRPRPLFDRVLAVLVADGGPLERVIPWLLEEGLADQRVGQLAGCLALPASAVRAFADTWAPAHESGRTAHEIAFALACPLPEGVAVPEAQADRLAAAIDANLVGAGLTPEVDRLRAEAKMKTAEAAKAVREARLRDLASRPGAAGRSLADLLDTAGIADGQLRLAAARATLDLPSASSEARHAQILAEVGATATHERALEKLALADRLSSSTDAPREVLRELVDVADAAGARTWPEAQAQFAGLGLADWVTLLRRAGGGDPGDLLDRARALKKRFRGAPAPAVTTPIREVAAATRAGFVARYLSSHGEPQDAAVRGALAEEAGLVHSSAQGGLALATAAATARGLSGLGAGGGGAGGAGGAPASTVADYPTFFGSPDACVGPEALSALGPAAYLVDLLYFLRDVMPDDRLLGALRARRPDIESLRLSEANATTPLPWIDVVNELLARELRPAPGSFETTWSAADLALDPEHLDREAAGDLRSAGYPLSLPFDLDEAEAREWLAELGLRRADVVREAVDAATPAGRARIARAELEITAREWEILTAGMPRVELAWGATGVEPGTLVSVAGGGRAGTWLVRTKAPGRPDLAWVEWSRESEPAVPFLSLLGISAPELEAVLASRFVQANEGGTRAPALVRDAADPCDLGKAQVVGLSAAARARIVHVLRLRARLGWSVADIDRALGALGVSRAPGEVGSAAALAQAEAALLGLATLARLVSPALPLASVLALHDLSDASPAAESARYDLLAQAAGRTAAETRSLAAILGARPFVTPEGTESFLEQSRILAMFGFAVSEVAFLVDAGAPPASPIGADFAPGAAPLPTDPALLARRIASAARVDAGLAGSIARLDFAPLWSDDVRAQQEELGRLQRTALLARRLGVAISFAGTHLSVDALLAACRSRILVGSGRDRAGVSPEIYATWGAAEITEAAVSTLRAAVEAHGAEGTWPSVARAVRDRVRALHRAALIAAAGAMHTVSAISEDAVEALYTRLLVDPLLAPGRQGTRVDLAISAVQRFVQRLLLGLERDGQGPSTLDDGARERWTWLSTYATWRDNREVFLYPEARLRPELRQDRSHLFEEAQNLLAQRDLTDASLEEVVAGYLHGLDDISRLEMMGACIEDPETRTARPAGVGEAYRLHLLARTHAAPRRYLLRSVVVSPYIEKKSRQTVAAPRFTPWQPLDLDVDGDWAMPMIRAERMEIYWVRHSRQIEGLKEIAGLVPASPFPLELHLPMLQDQYSLSWSAQVRGRWSVKQTIEQPVARPIFPFGAAQFAVREAGERVRIAGVSLPPPLPLPGSVGDTKPRDLPGQKAFQGFVDHLHDAVTGTRPSGGSPLAAPSFPGIGDIINQLKSATPDWPVLKAVMDIWGQIDALVRSGGPIEAIKTAVSTVEKFVGDVAGWVDDLRNASLGGVVKGAVGVAAGILGAFVDLIRDGLHKILQNGLGDDQIARLVQMLSQLMGPIQSLASWCGPTVGVEFGFFELGPGNARAVRLAPPKPPGATGLAPLGPLLLLSGYGAFFGAVTVAAEVLYTLFPGYPALYDVPVQTGLGGVSLPVGASEWEASASMTAPLWPGSGVYLNDLRAVSGSAATLSINHETLVAESASVGGRGDASAPAGADDGTVGGAADALSVFDPAGLLDALREGIRWVRPLPFEPFPGRYAAPNPSLVSDERRGRTFLLLPAALGPQIGWEAEPIHHPVARLMASLADGRGVGAVYDRAADPGDPWHRPSTDFQTSLVASTDAITPPDVPSLDLRPGTACGSYNWELLFHLPMLVGNLLRAARQYERALGWYARVFDGAAASGGDPGSAWRFSPFRDEWRQGEWGGGVAQALAEVEGGGFSRERWSALLAWRERPFDAHAVAGFRADAYPRAAFLRVVETFLDWGDQLFKLDPEGNAGEALGLYVRAKDLLGPRPRWSPRRDVAVTFAELAAGDDPIAAAAAGLGGAMPSSAEDVMAVLGPSLLRFALPPHPELERLWQRVDAGLAAVRASDGAARPGGEGPGDGLLAGAAGAFAAYSAAAPAASPYRFPTLLQKAVEHTGAAKALSAALQSALSTRDGEALARLRQEQEISTLDAARVSRELQVEEAKQGLAAAERSRVGAEIRVGYYRGREFMNAAEAVKEALTTAASVLQIGVSGAELLAAVFYPQPSISPGAGGHGTTPKADVTYGGRNIGDGLSAGARGVSVLASILRLGADLAGTMATYQRRQEEWEHQAELAENDVEACAAQVQAAQRRVEIASQELKNHDLQREHAGAVDAFYRQKFTSQELYEWMAEQLSDLSFEAYRLALDAARQAERAYLYDRPAERPASGAPFIAADAWQEEKKGLLAAERLERDLRRMEKAWMDGNVRDQPLERRVQLSRHDPAALLHLREQGYCVFDLPERLFDADHPGHYHRRIREVRLSIPCVAGPYTPVNATLRLDAHSVRISESLAPRYEETPGESPGRFFKDLPPLRSLATSAGMESSGATDWYPRDDRYMPFEGAGVVSTWRLELPRDVNRFDLDTITDVILDLKYTAKESGDPALAAAARAAAFAAVPAPDPGREARRLVSARVELPAGWYAFMHPNGAERGIEIRLTPEWFEHVQREQTIVVTEIRIIALGKAQGTSGATFQLAVADAAAVPQPLAPWDPAGGLASASWAFEPPLAVVAGAVVAARITTTTAALAGADLRDLFLLVSWRAE